MANTGSHVDESILRGVADQRSAGRDVIRFACDNGRVQTLTGEGLMRIARSWAGRLSAAGLGAGDRVLLVSSDSLELIHWFVGCAFLGAVPAIFPAHRGRAGKGGVVWQNARSLVDRVGFSACLIPTARRSEVVGELPGLVIVDESSAEREVAEPVEQGGDDPCFVQLTSGTGDAPKAVVHTHGRVRRYLDASRVAKGVEASDVIVSWLPLYHDLGLVSGLLSPLVLGARSVLMSPFRWVRNPALLLQLITHTKGTMCFMPNFAFSHLCRAVRERDLEGVDLSSLRRVGSGGEPVRASTMEQFRDRFTPFGLPAESLCAGYGMAEMVEAVSVTRIGDPVRIDEVDRVALEGGSAVPVGGGGRRIVSCGPPLPGCAVRITGDGGDLPERAVGEIWLRSDSMFEGYAGDPERSAEALCDGWLRTGDLGYVADGELYVVGRSKDLLIIGGRNVAPEEIESLAEGIDGLRPGCSVAFAVEDVRAATEKAVLVCESAEKDPEWRRQVESRLRRRSLERLGLALGRVVFVEPGWVAKSSSGKLARPANRARYERERAAAGRGL